MNLKAYLITWLAISVVGLALIFGGYTAGYLRGVYNGCVWAHG